MMEGESIRKFVAGIDIGEVTFRVSVLNTELLKVSRVFMHSLREKCEVVPRRKLITNTIDYCTKILVTELKNLKVYYVFVEQQIKSKSKRNDAIQETLRTCLDEANCFQVILVNPRSLKCYYAVYFSNGSPKSTKKKKKRKKVDDDESSSSSDDETKKKQKGRKYRLNKTNAVKYGQNLFDSKLKKQLKIADGNDDHNVYDSAWIAKYGFQCIIMKIPKKDIKPFEYKDDNQTMDYFIDKINSNNNNEQKTKGNNKEEEIIDLTIQ